MLILKQVISSVCPAVYCVVPMMIFAGPDPKLAMQKILPDSSLTMCALLMVLEHATRKKKWWYIHSDICSLCIKEGPPNYACLIHQHHNCIHIAIGREMVQSKSVKQLAVVASVAATLNCFPHLVLPHYPPFLLPLNPEVLNDKPLLCHLAQCSFTLALHFFAKSKLSVFLPKIGQGFAAVAQYGKI